MAREAWGPLVLLAAVTLTAAAAPTVVAHEGGYFYTQSTVGGDRFLDLPTGLVVETGDPADREAPVEFGDPAAFVRVDLYPEGQMSSLTEWEAQPCPRAFCVRAEVRLARANDLLLTVRWEDECHVDERKVGFPSQGGPVVTGIDAELLQDACPLESAVATMQATDTLLHGVAPSLRTSYTATDTL